MIGGSIKTPKFKFLGCLLKMNFLTSIYFCLAPGQSRFNPSEHVWLSCSCWLAGVSLSLHPIGMKTKGTNMNLKSATISNTCFSKFLKDAPWLLLAVSGIHSLEESYTRIYAYLKSLWIPSSWERSIKEFIMFLNFFFVSTSSKEIHSNQHYHPIVPHCLKPYFYWFKYATKHLIWLVTFRYHFMNNWK